MTARGATILCALALAASGALPAAAQVRHPCQLLQLAAIEMTTEPDGEVAVPVTVDGRAGLMLVDTGSVQSVIGETVASQLRLMVSRSPTTYMLFGGVPISRMAATHSFELGGMTAHDLPLLLAPFPALHNDTIGLLGPDIMGNYDVEFDFAAGRFKLFSPDHCAGQVVYWTRQSYAEVPITVDEQGHIEIPIALDGKRLTAAIDTGADRSTMTVGGFEELFGTKVTDKDMKVVAQTSINGTRPTTIYRYPFQAMTFEGVQVQRPNIDIVAGDRFSAGTPQMILGIETLRQLHLYIGYKAQKLYLTPAEAR